MRKRAFKSGFTLVEVMMAVFLVAVAATIIYTEMLVSYRIMMRARAKLEAQSLAFDRIWELCNQSDISDWSTIALTESEPTPADSIFGTAGIMEVTWLPSTNAPIWSLVDEWDITVTVWPPVGSPLQIGTNSLARYNIIRYRDS